MNEEKVNISIEDKRILDNIKRSLWYKLKKKIDEKLSFLRNEVIRLRYNLNKKVMLLVSKDKQKIEAMIKKESIFFDLCAYDEAQERKCSELLEWGLRNEKVKNIAVTGPYGSGKSSFLKSFEKRHDEYEYLNISLASFSDQSSNQNIVEENILQQIIYRKSVKKMEKSRISRIKEISKKDFFMKSIFVYLFLNITYVLFFKDKWILMKDLLIMTNILQQLNNKNLGFVFLNFMYIGMVLILIYNVVSKFSLNSIKFKHGNGEIEFGENKEISVFYKYLDEIIYFFKKAKYDVVFFEDIDRFEKIDIELFTKLRELNIILNESEEIKKTVHFIYAVKDDIFEKKEKNIEKMTPSYMTRAKFFDLIIPMIPIVNTTNTYDILVQKVEKIAGKINKNFKQNLKAYSYYVNDMRIINNIINEFIVYKKNLSKNSEEELRVLFGFIVYKNCYPKDFSNLHFEKGLVYNFITNKVENLKVEENRIKEKISKIKKEIETEKKRVANSLENLRRIFVSYLYEKIPNAKNFNEFTPTELVENKVAFESLIETSNIKCNDTSFYSDGIRLTNIVFSEIEQKVNIIYKEKEELLVGEKSSIKEKEKELKQYENELKIFEKEVDLHKSISKLREKFTRELIFSRDLLKENLLIYLLENEIVEENSYKDYISYFYGVRIKRSDFEFVKSIRFNELKPYDYPLEDIKEVISDLSFSDFNKKEILNFDLVFWLVGNNEMKDKSQLLDKILNLIKNLNNDEKLNYFESFLIYKKFDKLIYEFFLKLLENFLYVIFEMSEFSETKKMKHFIRIYKKIDVEILLEIENKEEIGRFINKQKDLKILELLYRNSKEKSLNFIKKVNFKLENLKLYNEKELFNELYKNNHYKLSFENICNIFVINIGKQEAEKSEYKNLTLIRKKEELKELSNYIDENFEEYLNNVFFKLESNTKESEETILSLLNDYSEDVVDMEMKKKIIEKQDNIYSDIIKIEEKELWETVVEQEKMKATWENILNYYEYKENKLDTHLINLFNRDNFLRELKEEGKLNKEHGASPTELSNSLYLEERVENEKLKIIIDNIYDFDIDQLEKIKDKIRVKLIVDTNSIWYDENEASENIKTLEVLEEFDLDIFLKFVLMNIDDIVNKINKYQEDISCENLNKIFNLSNMNIERKINFIKNIEFDNIDMKILGKSFKLFFESYSDLSSFESEKIEGLVKYSLLPLTQNSVDYLKEEYFDYYVNFIKENAEEFSKLPKKFEFDENDYLLIYQKIEEKEERLDFIKKINWERLSQNSEFVLEVCKDFSVGESYLSFSILSRLIKLVNAEKEKIELLSHNLLNISDYQTKLLIEKLEKDYNPLLTRETQHTMEDNNYNRKFLENLKIKGMIKKFKSKSNNKLVVTTNPEKIKEIAESK